MSKKGQQRCSPAAHSATMAMVFGSDGNWNSYPSGSSRTAFLNERSAGPSSSKCRLRASEVSASRSQANGLSCFELAAGSFLRLQVSPLFSGATFAPAKPASKTNDAPRDAIAFITFLLLMMFSLVEVLKKAYVDTLVVKVNFKSRSFLRSKK